MVLDALHDAIDAEDTQDEGDEGEDGQLVRLLVGRDRKSVV